MCAAMRATASPLPGRVAVLQIAPAAPVRVGHDGLAPDLVEGDVLRRVSRAVAIGIAANTRSGIARRPLQHLHAAHGAAEHAEQALDPEPVEQHRLGAHHVADGDEREIEAPGRARRRVGRGRAGRAHAAAEHVGADDEVSDRCRSAFRGRPWSPTSRACPSPGGCAPHAGRRSAHGRRARRWSAPRSARRRSGRRSARAPAPRRRPGATARPRRSARRGLPAHWAGRPAQG